MKPDRIPLIFFLLGVAIILFLAAPVWSTDYGHDSDSTVTTSSVLNNSVRDSSRSFGLGAGDVDINDCYRSWSVILYQDSKVNKLCLADRQIAQGLYEAGARTRCSVRSVVKDYDNFDHCVRLNTVVIYVAPAPAPEANFEEEEAEEEWREEQMQMQQDYDERIAVLEQRSSRPRVTREVIQQPFLSDEKRAKLQAVLDE